MFFFRHPKPVGDRRPVAVQVAEQKLTADFQTDVILVDSKLQEKDVKDCAPDINDSDHSQ